MVVAKPLLNLYHNIVPYYCTVVFAIFPYIVALVHTSLYVDLYHNYRMRILCESLIIAVSYYIIESFQSCEQTHNNFWFFLPLFFLCGPSSTSCFKSKSFPDFSKATMNPLSKLSAARLLRKFFCMFSMCLCLKSFVSCDSDLC